jgi:hypothetical protein
MIEKTTELAAKAFATALLSALLMFVVGYSEIEDAKSSRGEGLRLQRDISAIQSFAEATRTGLRSYMLAVSIGVDAKDEARIQALIVAIQNARATLEKVSRRVVATGSSLPDTPGSGPSRVSLNSAIRRLQFQLYFADLRLSEQDTGTLTPGPTTADLSVDVLARLGVGASADPVAIVKSLAWIGSADQAFDDTELTRLDRVLVQLAAKSDADESSLLRYSAKMLWDEWFKLKDDTVRIPSARLRDELNQATSRSLQTISERLLESIDKVSDEAIANTKVSVRPLEVAPALRLAILGYPYWIALLLIVAAASLATALRGADERVEWAPTIITLNPDNWLAWPYRGVRLFAGLLPIVVGVLVGVESAVTAKGLLVASIYFGGMVLAAIAAIAVVLELEGIGRAGGTGSASRKISAS